MSTLNPKVEVSIFSDVFIEIFQYEDILKRNVSKALSKADFPPRCPHETNPADLVDFD